MNGRNLCQNVRAVAIVLHHFVQAPYLTLNATQTFQVARARVSVNVRSVATGVRLIHWLMIGRVQVLAFPGNCFLLLAHSVTRRSRKLLVTTLTELNAIAALAIIGLSNSPNAGYNTPAAIGMPITL